MLEDKKLVWFEESNKYVQMEEPAYEVFKQLGKEPPNSKTRVTQLYNGQIEQFDISDQVTSGHSGGDKRFADDFIEAVRIDKEPVANLKDGLVSTVVANAIERARAQTKVIEIDPDEYEV